MNESAHPNASELKEVSPAYRGNHAEPENPDTAHLDDSLAMTPWERMLANDDMVNFGDSLRAAMEQRHAKSR
jgi:hypothetical protein